MGVWLRSCNVYGLGYCPTMSWSAIITVNSVCDICTSFATRLRFLICTHFGRFLDEFEYGVWVYKSFERVNLWYRCVYCDQSGDEWRVTEWESPWRSVSSPVWRVGRMRRRRSWCAWMFVGDRSIVVWGVDSADDRTAACLCVSLCRQLLRSAISYNKKLCRVCIWLCSTSVTDSSPSVVCWLYCVSWSIS